MSADGSISNDAHPTVKAAATCVCQHLGELVAVMFDSADDALFDMASHHASSDKTNYLDAMRALRLKRQAITSAFLDEVGRLFLDFDGVKPLPVGAGCVGYDSDDLALVSDDDTEERIAIANTLDRARSMLGELTGATAAALSRLPVDVPLDPGLADPARILDAFRRAIQPIKTEPRVKLIVLKLFELYVMLQLAPVYQGMLAALGSAGFNVADAHRYRGPITTGGAQPAHVLDGVPVSVATHYTVASRLDSIRDALPTDAVTPESATALRAFTGYLAQLDATGRDVLSQAQHPVHRLFQLVHDFAALTREHGFAPREAFRELIHQIQALRADLTKSKGTTTRSETAALIKQFDLAIDHQRETIRTKATTLVKDALAKASLNVRLQPQDFVAINTAIIPMLVEVLIEHGMRSQAWQDGVAVITSALHWAAPHDYDQATIDARRGVLNRLRTICNSANVSVPIANNTTRSIATLYAAVTKREMREREAKLKASRPVAQRHLPVRHATTDGERAELKAARRVLDGLTDISICDIVPVDQLLQTLEDPLVVAPQPPAGHKPLLSNNHEFDRLLEHDGEDTLPMLFDPAHGHKDAEPAADHGPAAPPPPPEPTDLDLVPFDILLRPEEPGSRTLDDSPAFVMQASTPRTVNIGTKAYKLDPSAIVPTNQQLDRFLRCMEAA